MTRDLQQTVADVAVPVGWGTWVFSHIVEVNEVLQFVLLITSITATVIAIRYHVRNTPK